MNTSLKTAALAVLAAAVLGAGCHSFMPTKPDYSDLPVDGIREVAIAIERAVQDGVREPSLPGGTGVVVSGESVVQAIRTRAARSELINGFRDTGHVAELRNGTITILNSREYKKSARRGEKSRNALLIMSENGDRWALYEGLLKDNNYPPRSLSAIQRIFYEARIDFLNDGQRYENAEGEYVYVGGAPVPAAN